MKQIHHNGPIQHSTLSAIHEAIAKRAYELWMREGSQDNQADSNWLDAEQELVTGRRVLPPATTDRPVSP